MFLGEILDLVVPLKIELQKRKTFNELKDILESTQEEVSLLIIERRDVLSKASSLKGHKVDIERIADVLATMAIVLPDGVNLFGRSYNAIHPEEKKEKVRRKRSFGHLKSVHKGSSDETKRPLFKRKRRLGNSDRVL